MADTLLSDELDALGVEPVGDLGWAFGDPDKSKVFRVAGVLDGVNYAEAQNSPAGSNPVLIAKGADTNIAFGVAAKGNGKVYLANGAGIGFSLLDPGAISVVNFWAAKGAASGAKPQLNAGTEGGTIEAPLTKPIQITINGTPLFQATSSVTPGSFLNLLGGSDNIVRLYARAPVSTDPASLYLSALNGGALYLAGTAGVVAEVRTAASGSVANKVVVIAGAAGNPATIQQEGEAGGGLLIRSNGTGHVQVQRLAMANERFDEAVSRQVVTTGFSISWPASTSLILLDPAGTLASGTITLPAAEDGRIVGIQTTQTISALTLSGGTVVGADASLQPSAPQWFRYSSAAAKWVRYI